MSASRTPRRTSAASRTSGGSREKHARPAKSVRKTKPAASKKVAKPARPATGGFDAAAGSRAVDAYMAKLVHARKAEIETLRALFLAADPRVREEVKWNAPSFRVQEHFATMNVRASLLVAKLRMPVVDPM